MTVLSRGLAKDFSPKITFTSKDTKNNFSFCVFGVFRDNHSSSGMAHGMPLRTNNPSVFPQ